jgi:hypothetical protein
LVAYAGPFDHHVHANHLDHAVEEWHLGRDLVDAL